MKNMSPTFTIITATFNAASPLPHLLASLAEQSCRDFELIIQDGASTDDTVAIAEQWRERLPQLSVRSEADCGIYDAWNKALIRARGKWILFLGADDMLAEQNVLARAQNMLFPLQNEVVYALGHIKLVNLDGSEHAYLKSDVIIAQNSLKKHISFGHPALFHRAILFTNESFDTSFRIAGDYDFLARTWTYSNQGFSFDFLVTVMSTGGCSYDPKNLSLLESENARVVKTYFPLHYYTKYLPVRFFAPVQSGLLEVKLIIKSLCLHSVWSTKLYFFLKTKKNNIFRK